MILTDSKENFALENLNIKKQYEWDICLYKYCVDWMEKKFASTNQSAKRWSTYGLGLICIWSVKIWIGIRFSLSNQWIWFDWTHLNP